MHWRLSHRADRSVLPLADRHYNRQKPGTPQFVPPGRCLVLHALDGSAFWITSWPFEEYVKHDWGGAWVCSAFRNEGAHLSSELIRGALAATRWFWPTAPAPWMVTFVDSEKVRRKRNPGRCYLKAGFHRPPCPACNGEKHARRKCKRCRTSGLAYTKRGLVVLRMALCDMPDAAAPIGAQRSLLEAA